MRFPKNRSEAKIANFDFPLVTIDKDIVTLEISVDDWRVMTMEIEKPSQDLPAPMLHCPNVHSLVLLPVPSKDQKQEKPRLGNHQISNTHLLEIKVSKEQIQKSIKKREKENPR